MKYYWYNTVLYFLSQYYEKNINFCCFDFSNIISPCYGYQKLSAIVIHDPWIRTAPPNAPMLGLFMKIRNNTNQDIRLVSVQATGYVRAELHRTINHNGIMKMQKQSFMPISAQGDLDLKPGSWHIMLIGPEIVPKEGDTSMIYLEFDNGTTQTIHVQVGKGKIMMKHNHYTY